MGKRGLNPEQEAKVVEIGFHNLKGDTMKETVYRISRVIEAFGKVPKKGVIEAFVLEQLAAEDPEFETKEAIT